MSCVKTFCIVLIFQIKLFVSRVIWWSYFQQLNFKKDSFKKECYQSSGPDVLEFSMISAEMVFC